VEIDAAALRTKRVAAVLNLSSGSADGTSADKMRAIFDAAGLAHATLRAVTAEAIDAALDEALEETGDGDGVLVVLGGDGTIMTAAAKCGQCGVLLIPLPGGTMNMLPRALYGPHGWEQVLADTLADPEVRTVSGGKAGEHAFYCVAILGTPTLWADVREALRRLDLAGAAKRSVTALRRHGRNMLDYDFGGAATGSAEAVAVLCPLVSRRLAEDARTLEAVALAPATAAEVVRLALRAMLDDWRNDPSVERAKARSVTVTGHGRVPVILDGESVRMGRTVTISFQPVAFRALAPAHRP
jgi:diacylglycerol kinase family enzyme